MVSYKLKSHFKSLRWGKTAAKSVIASSYQSPLVSSSQKISETRFLAIDCEMTGLDPKKDKIISIGWVEIRQARLELSSAHHSLIYSDKSVGESARIHGVGDKRVAGAATIARTLTTLAKRLEGKVALFHHAPLDIAFLQKAAMQTFGCPLLFAFIDTLQVERKRLALKGKQGSLQLTECRNRYDLPLALEHNALEDARATGELFLAQTAHMGKTQRISLRDLGLHCS